MSVAVANVLSSSANAALNTYISPRYSQAANRMRAPGQPTPSAFGIWFPIFAGQIAYGFLPEEERSDAASMWNHAIQAGGAAYAWTLVNKRFYSMQAAMSGMTFANFMYLRNLPEPRTVAGRLVGLTAELGLGWLICATTIVDVQNVRRWLRRDLTHGEQDALGTVEAAFIAGTAVTANRMKGWRGVSLAAAWALGGIALDRKSEKHVRAVAGVAAVGVLADLAHKFWSDRRNQTGLRAGRQSSAPEIANDQEDYAVIVEDTFIPPNMIVEEVTTVRI